MVETILIVNDEVDVRGLVGLILTQHGHRTLGARNGQEALDVFQAYQDRIKLVITDGHMPGITGAEFIATLRRLKPGIGILICNGLIERAAPRVSGEEMLMKPFEPGTLLSTVHRLLHLP